MSKILVTGGAGMIGSNLVKRLLLLKHGVIVVDNLWRGKLKYLKRHFHNLDLTIPNVCDFLLRDVDYVIHLADIVSGIGYVLNNESTVFRQNLLINSNILASARKFKLSGFIYIGTACSFPQEMQNDYKSNVLRESDLYPAHPESAYGWSKLMGQYETTLMHKETKIPTANLILHNVYGTPTDFSNERSQVIPALIKKAIEYPQTPFVIWGSGLQSRAFLHVNDVVTAIVLTLERGLDKGDFQIGPSKATTIREIAETIIKISRKPIDIIYDTSKPEGDKARCADYSKAKRELNWEPTVDLKQGLTETYRWIKSQMKNTSN
jgi:GDP-D-mannose 3',5'-epimerase